MDIDIVNQNLIQSKLAKSEKQAKNAPEKAEKEKQLQEAAAGFESILIYNMLKSMRGSLPGNAVFPESNSMNIYRSMYDQYLAERLSTGETSMGVRQFLFEQLKNSI